MQPHEPLLLPYESELFSNQPKLLSHEPLLLPDQSELFPHQPELLPD